MLWTLSLTSTSLDRKKKSKEFPRFKVKKKSAFPDPRLRSSLGANYRKHSSGIFELMFLKM